MIGKRLKMTYGTIFMRRNMPDYLQGEIAWADYPLSDKPEKSKIRPVIIISNADSNELDNDFLIIPVTSKIRNQRFEILLTADKVSAPLPALSAVRCNKLHTIRKTRITGSISAVEPAASKEIIETVNQAIRPINAEMG